jgi:hypothetical protein
MSLPNPADFTNPLEARITELQARYKKEIAEGKMFADMKLLKEEIKLLKAALSTTPLHERNSR